MIKIGTSGFQFADWRGRVYPEGLRREDMLRYYQEELGFRALELNYTYYTLPSQRAVAGLAQKTVDDFEFCVKAHRALTHEIPTPASGRLEVDVEVCTRFRYALEPLQEAGKLAAVLAQFPYSFRFNLRTFDYLKKFRQYLAAVPLVVEFRHVSWHNPKVMEFLRAADIGYCVVDEPRLARLVPFLAQATSSLGYFRFHGRNPRWFEAPANLRYDYCYSLQELQSFIGPIKKVAQNTQKTFAFFNNCHAGAAAENAQQLATLLK